MAGEYLMKLFTLREDFKPSGHNMAAIYVLKLLQTTLFISFSVLGKPLRMCNIFYIQSKSKSETNLSFFQY